MGRSALSLAPNVLANLPAAAMMSAQAVVDPVFAAIKRHDATLG
jgi:hypothetical protein